MHGLSIKVRFDERVPNRDKVVRVSELSAADISWHVSIASAWFTLKWVIDTCHTCNQCDSVEP